MNEFHHCIEIKTFIAVDSGMIQGFKVYITENKRQRRHDFDKSCGAFFIFSWLSFFYRSKA
jgi:hypothetical protein